MGSISGYVYTANDAVTTWPGNGSIPGVTIELYDSTTANLFAVTQTDDNGYYLLPNLPAGSYYLHEVQPDGYSQGGIFPGSIGGFSSSVDLILGISLGAGVNAVDYNYSEVVNEPTPTPSSTPTSSPTPSATPDETTCQTTRPDLTMVEITNSAIASLLINGNGTFGDGTVSIDLSSFTGNVFDWTSNIGISTIFVRTANGGSLFEYNPAATAASGIGTASSITFVSFCYQPAGGSTPTPTPNNPTPTPTLPDTTVAPAIAAGSSTGGALLAGALILILAAATALGSGWRRNRRLAKAPVKSMWSTGPRT